MRGPQANEAAEGDGESHGNHDGTYCEATHASAEAEEATSDDEESWRQLRERRRLQRAPQRLQRKPGGLCKKGLLDLSARHS